MAKLGILGSRGRMGHALLAALADHPGLELAGAHDQGDGDAGVLARSSDVLVDFTHPDAFDDHLTLAQQARTAIVIGTTGLSGAQHAAIDAAAHDIAVLQAANTSLGVTLLMRLVEQAAARLDWDIEIAELHHRHKVDAPSGTALALGAAAARGRGVALDKVRADDRRDQRTPGSIGFASLRGGTAAGDHRVLLLGPGERLELSHIAEDRAIFANGALSAAAWLAGRPPGRYAMTDVLGR